MEIVRAQSSEIDETVKNDHQSIFSPPRPQDSVEVSFQLTALLRTSPEMPLDSQLLQGLNRHRL